MNSTVKNTAIVLLLFLVAFLGFKLFIKDLFTDKDHAQIDSTIVVQRIQKVMKLVTVEGHFSELMNYRDFDYVDFPGFRKDAIIQVDAVVSIGYNLDSLKISANEKEKKIVISNMPKPSIISIDSDTKFKNISEGLFTSFNESELTKLNLLGKQKIREKAMNGDLIQKAEEQKSDIFDLLFYMAKENGYTIIIEGSELKPILNLKN